MTVETPTENALVAQDGIGGFRGLESVEARLTHYKKNEAVFEESINVLKLKVKLRDTALVKNKKKLEKAEKERDELKLTLEKFQNSSKSLSNLLESQVIDKFKTGLGYNAASSTAASPAVESFVNSSEMLENQEYNKSKSDKGYHAVPPPYTGNFIPFKPNLTFMDEIVESENMDVTTIVAPSNGKKVVSNHESAGVKSNGDTVEPKTLRKNSFRPSLIEDWNSDDESEVEIIPKVKTVSSSTEKIKFVKSARETEEKIETSKQNKHYPRGNQRNWNNLMSQRLGRVNGVNTRDRAVVSENKGKGVNAVKASACWGNPQQKEYKEKGAIDSGCSWNMTRNKCYLTEYEDYDGGFVSFRDGKGRISGKVSKICYKKNNVLFTDTECLVLSSDFKLLDESQVLLRVLRKDKIYSVDLKSVVPTKGLTCLFAKATIDESNLWHMRLGHINFKNINKLVKGNLDETSGILKTFIIEIENQLDHKVKLIKCDNGTEFKNSVMNQLCEMNGIKREFSVARTTQQNGVAKKRNRILIEAARTILVDSKLPTTFWAEEVNTACYVLNKVLVIKPHNKTPYELIRRRTPLIDFMKPFGCLVTILNTRDHLGKFDGKADEGFFVGTPFNAAGPSFSNNDPSLLVNAAEASNAFEEHLFERFSPFKNAYTLPPISNVTPMDDTRIFGNAYDDEDVGAEATLNNLEKHENKSQRLSELLIYLFSLSNGTQESDSSSERSKLDRSNARRASTISTSEGLDTDVATRFLQEGRIDYDEVFGPIARIEAIRLFLAYASFMGFIVYQMDVKGAFLYGTIDEEVYVDDIIFGSTKKSLCDEFEGLMHKRFQMSSIGELTFFLGLQVQQKKDRIFIIQDQYVANILKKFDFATVKTTSTPIEPNKALVKDEEAEAVDVHLYRSMIGSLMYLTAFRPDIMFAVCACARDLPFDLEAFSDSDYAGASLDKKSTTGAEYVAAVNCCGQMLWIQNQMLDYGFNFMNTKIFIDNESTICIVKNLVFHSKTKHIEIRHHFIRDCYEKKLIQVIKIHTDHNVADLLTKAFDVSRFNFLIASIGLLNL
ncbi:putative ribonuclease H-like domain-containing protein [Tanacetum coccineum]